MMRILFLYIYLFFFLHFSTGDKWQKLSGNLEGGKKQVGWVKYINPSSVTVEVQHFSWYRISSLFNRPLKRTLVMYMTPGIIKEATAVVYVTAYAIQEKLSEVSHIHVVLSIKHWQHLYRSMDGNSLIIVVNMHASQCWH